MGAQSRHLELVNVLDESLKNRLNFFNNMDLLSKTVAAQIVFCKLVEDQTEGWVEGCMLR